MMEESSKPQSEEQAEVPQRHTAAFSVTLSDGALAEMVYDPGKEETRFALWRDGEVSYERTVTVGKRTFVPYSPYNSLLEHKVILLPSQAEDYGTEEELIDRIARFLHGYIDITPSFERLATYYVLLSWVYDDFNELPYLRALGDYGTGKTRFLLTVGSLCFRPIFAGASTVSPIFRILDACRGTLVIDEGDFRQSDEKAEIIKILNCGHSRGFPVLRSESFNQREFSPQAYQVFGPKILATRGFFEDRALESRCLTETLGGRKLRDDIPINLTDEHEREALVLRNQLLMFRFRNLGRKVNAPWVERGLEPRLNQVFGALMSIIDDEDTRHELRQLAFEYQGQLVSDRGFAAEGQVLEVIQELEANPDTQALSVSNITKRFIERFENDYDRKITPKWIGGLIRQRLGLRTERRNGPYFISQRDKSKLPQLYAKYGLSRPEENPAQNSLMSVPSLASGDSPEESV